MPDAPGAALIPEPTPVQLTRMEGVLNLITHQLTEAMRTVEIHGERLSALELATQRLGDNAVADARTVEQTARALKDAKEAAEATSRAEQAKAAETWTPLTRMFAGVAAFTSLLGAYFAMKP